MFPVIQLSSLRIPDASRADSGDDFFDLGGSFSVTIKAGEESTTIQIPIENDILEEIVEYFDVEILSSLDGEVSDDNTTRVTINDDDGKLCFVSIILNTGVVLLSQLKILYVHIFDMVDRKN